MNKFESLLRPYSAQVYAFMRIVVGVAFAFHGVQKIFGVLTEHVPPMMSQLWIGGVLELVCGLAITLGALTSVAAFVASGMMAVAYTQFHWVLQFDQNFFPAVNGGELAVVYALLFLFIATQGGGAYSVDAALAKGAPAPSPEAEPSEA